MKKTYICKECAGIDGFRIEEGTNPRSYVGACDKCKITTVLLEKSDYVPVAQFLTESEDEV
jgi:hypothetical protein